MNNPIFNEALYIFPRNFRDALSAAFSGNGMILYEIRLYRSRPTAVITDRGARFISSAGHLSFMPAPDALTAKRGDIEEILNKAAGFSYYAHESEYSQGYISYGPGIRIGVCSDSGSEGFSYSQVTSLNIRIPCDPLLMHIDIPDILRSGQAESMLIAGQPASGKTTVLKAIALHLAGAGGAEYRRVAIIDERREFSGIVNGGLGCCADVITGIKKGDGIQRALRLMSPDIIICDEIGSAEETDEILSGLNSGVKFIASIHAGSLSELCRREQFRRLYYDRVFEYIVFLSANGPGKIEKIYSYSEVCDEISEYSAHLRLLYTGGNIQIGRNEKTRISAEKAVGDV